MASAPLASSLDHLSKRRRKLEQLHRKTLAFSGNTPPSSIDLTAASNHNGSSSSDNASASSRSSISSDSSVSSSNSAVASITKRTKHQTAFSLASPSSLSSYLTSSISSPSSPKFSALSKPSSSSSSSSVPQPSSSSASHKNHHRSRLPKDFDKTQVRRSCTALLKYAHSKFSQQNKPVQYQQYTSIEDSLAGPPPPPSFPYGEPIYLTIQTVEEIASLRAIVPYLIPLPNRIRPKLSDLSICLITRDPRAPIVAILESDKDSPTHGVFTEIVSVGKLRSKLISFADTASKKNRRKHLDQDTREPPQKKSKHAIDNPHKAAPGFVKSFDIIVNDSEITAEHLTKIFGPGVYLKAPGLKVTIPVPVSLQPPVPENSTPIQAQKIKDTIADPMVIKNQLKYIARSSAVIKAPGKNLPILVGLSSFTPEQLMENIAATISNVLQKQGGLIDGSWDNVKAISIKTAKSASMPIYQNTAATVTASTLKLSSLKNATENDDDEEDDD